MLQYEDLRKLKDWDELYEYDMWIYIKFKVNWDVEEEIEEWYSRLKWFWITEDGKEIPYLVTKECFHYCSDFYLPEHLLIK